MHTYYDYMSRLIFERNKTHYGIINNNKTYYNITENWIFILYKPVACAYILLCMSNDILQFASIYI